MRVRGLAGPCLAVGMSLSCTMLPTFRSDPPAFAAPEMASVEDLDPFPNWSVSPDEIEALLERGGHNEVLVSEAKGGTTGARKVQLHNVSSDRTFGVKWKAMTPPRWVDVLPFAPGMLDGVNNSPRKEIAAWKIQQLLFDPSDYVVPTAFPLCISLETARKVDGSAEPTLEGSRCVLGLVSLWMQDVTLPDPLLDAERFRSDPVYAYYLANFNLLTYVIEHHDGRQGNFLVSADDARRQVFSIDNGVSFGGIFYNWFVANWSDIRVPALRKASIDRLRQLEEADLQRALGVLAELRLDDEGVFEPVPPGANLDGDDGIRYAEGRLQLGLTDDEIEDVWERIRDLVEAVDDGDVPVF